MKLCRGCGQRKPLDLFRRQAANRTGASHYCKSCGSQRSREARESDPLFAERRRAYRSANADKLRDAARNRYRADPLRAKVSTWRNQGIEMTAEQYRAMHADQQGACAICRKTEAQNGKALAVDHDHETGRVRGLLCDQCNIALGRFQDSPENLRRALDYLGA
ncbi:hypothetical protein BWO91_06290 [Plantibacter flavus]|uniref:endonuclease VII domain-containing protein n=1 Tax=Plantibacter flavus TaxID=150123 RepID=UPI00099D51BC|nr:hypothetical protein BWO91_06290 [Plantibacter flavus]